jgi:hypothetical protein
VRVYTSPCHLRTELPGADVTYCSLGGKMIKLADMDTQAGGVDVHAKSDYHLRVMAVSGGSRAADAGR